MNTQTDHEVSISATQHRINESAVLTLISNMLWANADKKKEKPLAWNRDYSVEERP